MRNMNSGIALENVLALTVQKAGIRLQSWQGDGQRLRSRILMMASWNVLFVADEKRCCRYVVVKYALHTEIQGAQAPYFSVVRS
jgi:hypothetical protein